MGIIEIQPGCRMPARRHNCEEVYHVLHGRGEVTSDGVPHPLEASDAANTVHTVRNTGGATLWTLCGAPQLQELRATLVHARDAAKASNQRGDQAVICRLIETQAPPHPTATGSSRRTRRSAPAHEVRPRLGAGPRQDVGDASRQASAPGWTSMAPPRRS
jgi:uncharacterized cupin superfamily protein